MKKKYRWDEFDYDHEIYESAKDADNEPYYEDEPYEDIDYTDGCDGCDG